ncbi:MAG: hypothetical protein LBI96_00675 [Odoribacteraceae bacterium]|jgi:hypothetical protein|nr:hypothetical protein [Odoribacteraceae bacterium]
MSEKKPISLREMTLFMPLFSPAIPAFETFFRPFFIFPLLTLVFDLRESYICPVERNLWRDKK